MLVTSSITSISWIPVEAMSGPMRLPMDIGIGHYDPPPPDEINDSALDALRDEDRFRFANRLEAWIEVQDGEIADAGYTGRAVVGSTTARLGIGSLTFQGVGYPLLQEEPRVEGRVARFVQTAGGRTGAPFPHRIDHPPFIRVSGPTAWTTLAVEISAEGSSRHEIVGASPFPRHWIYDDTGRLVQKSGLIDFREWTRNHDHSRSPWHGVQRETRVADAVSAVEREISREVMAAGATIRQLDVGEQLTTQGEPGDDLYLILDGMLEVEIDGDVLAEVGPGAIVGEMAILEGGPRTATIRALTPGRVAVVGPEVVDADALRDVASGRVAPRS